MFWNYYFTQMMTTTMNKPLTLMGRGSVLEGLEQLLVGFLVLVYYYHYPYPYPYYYYYYYFIYLFIFYYQINK